MRPCIKEISVSVHEEGTTSTTKKLTVTKQLQSIIMAELKLQLTTP